MMQLLVNPRTKIKVDNFLKNPSHALIISGQKHSGKSCLAEYIAKEILELPDIEIYPYLHKIEPVDNKLGIEQVRELQDLVKLKTPSPNKISRILIIYNADIFGEEAQNALLKTLEEPPIDTILMLLVDDENKMLDTVKSRSVIIELQSPTKDQLLQKYLDLGYAKKDIERAIALGSNRERLVENILKNEDSDHETIINETKQILSSSEFERLIKINELSKDKLKTMSIVDSLMLISRLAMKNTNEQEQSKRWHKILKNSDQASNRLSKNGNAKIILTDLFLNL